MPTFVCGLDLGQAVDYSALIVVERHLAEQEARYDVRHIERFPLRTPYPTIVEDVCSRLNGAPLAGQAQLLIDGTGVGRGVVDLFRAPLGETAIPVTITASGIPTLDEDGYWHVAKRDLIGIVQVLLQTGRLRFARLLPNVGELTAELQSYQVKITAAANDTYNAREGQHDDLVLALALACWAGEYPDLNKHRLHNSAVFLPQIIGVARKKPPTRDWLDHTRWKG